VFLSYASEDTEAARRIADALRAAGVEVWFDKSELRGGEAWDQSIRRQIRECTLFMPVISARTEARREGYFRLEWRLAVERTNLMADSEIFLVPVVIDSTNETTARVPDRFRERQWLRFPCGDVSTGFVDQVRQALHAADAGVQGGIAAVPGSVTPARSGRMAGRRWLWSGAAAAALMMILLMVTLRSWHSPGSASTATAARAPPASARESPAAVSSASGPAIAAPSRKSIAVLPFQNLTGRAEDAYLGDGMQEEILNTLARIRDLNVISRTSTSEYRGTSPNIREIGQRLGAGSVLEGSVRREGQKLRLTVQLIDTSNDRHILAADYDRDMGHILGLQSEVASKIAAALAATLSSYERGDLERVGTNNGDAYNLYLRAQAVWRRVTPADETGVRESRRLLEQVLHLDPDYTDALAMLSRACTWSFFSLGHEADADCARRNYERALALDPRFPEARLARGVYEMYVRSDLDAAYADLDAVVRLRPNSAEAHQVLGLVLRRRSRFDEALIQLTRAWDLDPLNRAYAGGAYNTLTNLRRFRELIAQTQLFARRFPSEGTSAMMLRAVLEGRLQGGLEPLRRALREHGRDLDAETRNRMESLLARGEGRYLDALKYVGRIPPEDPVDLNLRRGMLYWAAGRSTEGKQRFQMVERDGRAILRREPSMSDLKNRLAVAQSMLGDHAAALATIDAQRDALPESRDPVNGPQISFLRSIILVRAGRTAEGYAEVQRLLRVPFGAPTDFDSNGVGEILLAVKDDPHFDELINHPPRL
jgi:TolB-like protein/lipoprotein NlpI